MRERICFLCDSPLDFEDCLRTNMIIRGTEKERNDCINHLTRQWESNHTEFYCCSCKRMIDSIKNGPSDLYALLDWAKNGRLMKLKQLGILGKEDLMEIERIRNE